MREDFRRTEKKAETQVLVVDGYLDEPSLLGVPPYISPEPRLLAGVLEEECLDWEYVTADEYRVSGLPKADKILVYGGATVPGNYLSATPLSQREAEEISKNAGETFLGGPLARYENVSGYDHYVEKDFSAYFHDYLTGRPRDRWITPKERERWLVKGTEVVKRHPMYPDPLIAEMSMYRGCPRYFTGGCSFCSEPYYGEPVFREQDNIVREIKTLYDLGLRNFRLGGQSCTISYRAEGIGSREVPVPQPKEIKILFEDITETCPDIKVLHLDNANPAVISSYPQRSRKILKILVKHTSPGNVLALGMESADPEVIRQNNLNANPKQVEDSVRIINEIGRGRGVNGMPKLLPGINFLGGLKGESSNTYEKNFDFLEKIKNEGYLLRRINIRQVLSRKGEFKMDYKSDFVKFKKKVREKIDRPLLKKMLPRGTLLRDVYMEKREGNKTFGRQIATYPLLVGVEYPLDLGKYYDIAVTDYGYRSITGVHQPLPVSKASLRQLKAIPGVGEKRAAKIFRKQPNNEGEFKELFQEEDVVVKILKFLQFNQS
ncbi:hypothetical protein AKJ37_03490 [candidate division MSBL1 archaeon SCGC-AAA259I09]|uniref:Radical SAM core domain-containing protein n=2 Tax=candidate division MSBL1 TaxID=215777 RepID=A0A133USH2_9EURY|nr:hypothetical protein AKJ62_02980 [candidate division MSBL1 archaeon SCGC-AAA259D14]KXA97184.1 hypothetical protein AKJ37_03490 [candidate division MSBL1 archaeon SCGC-AAA259I09]